MIGITGASRERQDQTAAVDDGISLVAYRAFCMLLHHRCRSGPSMPQLLKCWPRQVSKRQQHARFLHQFVRLEEIRTCH